MLNEQLQKQIEQEADVITARMNDRNDYEAGKIKGFEEGYIKAGEKYADKWQAAQARAERYEKALREIKKGLNWIENSRELDIIHEALTPKTSSDELNFKNNKSNDTER